jgi:low affinity Fe/Cu permease
MEMRKDAFTTSGIIAAILTIIAFLANAVAWSPLARTTSLTFAISATIITSIFGILSVFVQAREVRAKRTKERVRPLKITLEVYGSPITLETTDAEQVAEFIKVMQDLQASRSSNVQAEANDTKRSDSDSSEKEMASLGTGEDSSSSDIANTEEPQM